MKRTVEFDLDEAAEAALADGVTRGVNQATTPEDLLRVGGLQKVADLQLAMAQISEHAIVSKLRAGDPTVVALAK